MQIILSYSNWFYLLCFVIALLFSGLLYYKNAKDEIAKSWRIVLASLRFLLVFCLCLLLLSPLVKLTKQKLQKPLLIFAVDHSSSMSASSSQKEIEKSKRDLEEKWTYLKDKLSSQYDLYPLAFGEKTRDGFDFSFSDKQSDLSELFNHVRNRFSDRSSGAFILLSDGLYNKGIEPSDAYRSLPFPLYTLAWGDTTQHADIKIEMLRHNAYVFRDQSTPLEVDLFATKAAGKKINIELYKGKQCVDKRSVLIPNNAFAKTVSFQIQDTNAGWQGYRIRCSEFENEKNIFNNHKDFFIEVIDGRQKILIAAASAHPDISAIKQSLETYERYQVQTAIAPHIPNDISTYQLIIFHQLPSSFYNIDALLNICREKKISTFFIIGKQTNLSTLEGIESGISIRPIGKHWEEATAIYEKSFGYFNLSETSLSSLENFPPLNVPLANYQTIEQCQIFCRQKIGQVVSSPLWIFGISPKGRYSVLCGSGLWRWRLQDFHRTQNTEAFDEIIGKAVQFLSVKKQLNPLQIECPGAFSAVDNIEILAQLYNESFENIPNADISIVLSDSNKKEYLYAFSPAENSYRVKIGNLPAGQYTYRAETQVGNQKLKAIGHFSVSDYNVEYLRWDADHALLARLSNENRGEMYKPSELSLLVDKLLKSEDYPAVRYNEDSYFELIHKKLVFFILLLCLSFEWFIRKWFGLI